MIVRMAHFIVGKGETNNTRIKGGDNKHKQLPDYKAVLETGHLTMHVLQVHQQQNA